MKFSCISLMMMLLAVAYKPCPAIAETSKPVAYLTVDLADGSRVVGTTTMKSLPVRTDFGNVEVQLDKVQRVGFKQKQEEVVLDLRNGDKLTGFLRAGSWEIATLFGNVKVPLEKVREARVRLTNKTAVAGLLLWNRLDSKDNIENSDFGPGGSYHGGTFGEGKFGQAFVVRCDQTRQVTFTASDFKADAGCIEFWAKLTGLPHELAWGQNPTLVRICAGDQQYLLHLNGNDGDSRGGLCSQAGLFARSSTGRYGSWTYAKVLGDGQVDNWHHYALVWDRNGIAGLGDSRQRIAVYLDGVLNSSEAGNDTAPPSLENAQLELLFIQGSLGQGTIAFDNIKVWDHAKTDFSDRDEE